MPPGDDRIVTPWSTDYVRYDFPDPELICAQIMIDFPHLSPSEYRMHLLNILYWQRRGAWIGQDWPEYNRLENVRQIADELIPLPTETGQLELL